MFVTYRNSRQMYKSYLGVFSAFRIKHISLSASELPPLRGKDWYTGVLLGVWGVCGGLIGLLC